MSSIAQTAIITGAGSGIGFAMADSFVREGVDVPSTQTALRQASEELKKYLKP